MYAIGQLVCYGSNGVYRVEDIGPISHIRGYDPRQDYYKFSSLQRGEVTYVPVNSGVFMRPVISREEAERLLESAPALEAQAYASRDPRALREHYKEIMDAHSCEALVGLIKSINAKERQAAGQGKRVGKTDQEYKKRAQQLLAEELGAVLEVPVERAQEMLTQALR